MTDANTPTVPRPSLTSFDTAMFSVAMLRALLDHAASAQTISKEMYELALPYIFDIEDCICDLAKDGDIPSGWPVPIKRRNP